MEQLPLEGAVPKALPFKDRDSDSQPPLVALPSIAFQRLFNKYAMIRNTCVWNVRLRGMLS
jgi:hypothetical protein